jgi:hypothetical protein
MNRRSSWSRQALTKSYPSSNTLEDFRNGTNTDNDMVRKITPTSASTIASAALRNEARDIRVVIDFELLFVKVRVGSCATVLGAAAAADTSVLAIVIRWAAARDADMSEPHQ